MQIPVKCALSNCLTLGVHSTEVKNTGRIRSKVGKCFRMNLALKLICGSYFHLFPKRGRQPIRVPHSDPRAALPAFPFLGNIFGVDLRRP